MRWFEDPPPLLAWIAFELARDGMRSTFRRRAIHYRRARRRWRVKHPARSFALDARAVYVAPPELRVRVGVEDTP